MRTSVLALTLAVFSTLAALPVAAQGLRLSRNMSPELPAAPAVISDTQRQADFIVAVVNTEPITNYQVSVEVRRVLQQLSAQRRTLPEPAEVARQVLERMISDKTQLQLARETGIRVDEAVVDQAEQSVARQNQFSVAELHQRLAADGVEVRQFREQLREQLMITRLRERDMEPRARVSDAEVDQYLQEQNEKNKQLGNQLIHIAQILVAVPEEADDKRVDDLRVRANWVLARAKSGEDFAALAREVSNSPDRNNAGQLGLRSAERYPPLFVEAVQNLAVGDITGPVRSGAGFHVLKLLEKRSEGMPAATVVQQRARHILLRPSAQLSEGMARDKLNDFRRRLNAGQTDFATLAKENSQDGSAEAGGDLGWANPGQFVPEFEEVLNRLNPGQISEPLISRFGVHLIQLLERRNATLGEREQRELVRAQLREKKLDDTFAIWAQEVRAKAYVELRDPPQANQP
jgi:peptidyl-prolyl cis-trans isomerase SurA